MNKKSTKKASKEAKSKRDKNTRDYRFKKREKTPFNRQEGLAENSYAKGYIQEILVDERSEKLAAIVVVAGKEILVEELPDDGGVGDLIAFKLRRRLKKIWLADFIRYVDQEAHHIGVYRKEEKSIYPIHRKRNFHPILCLDDHLDDQSVVIFDEKNGVAEVKQFIGNLNSSKTISKLAAFNQDVWNPVTVEEEEACKNMSVPPLGEREDLRNIPLVTIDGFDAKDFDDAVYAEKDDDPKNPDGYKLIVAIADVAYYVRESSVLDQYAKKRGNSVYFPDFVLPMLPERLSNGLCSLRPNEDRACIACHMTISKHGKMRSFRFSRALMRSHARLTYEEVEKALIRGKLNKNTELVFESTLKELYQAYKLLRKARDERGSLEISSDEYQIIFDDKGEVADVELRRHLTAHEVIEEMMISANVAAARALQNAGWPCVYRVHDKPDPTRLLSIKSLLQVLKLPAVKTDKPSPKDLNAVLRSVKDSPYESMINSLILRSQAQAQYSPVNIGHYGLGLADYAHFTSPIRRYSDLIVHRLLISKFKMGEGGFDYEQLVDVCDHISKTERKAAAAEREATERFMARHLSHHIGDSFDAVVVGVTNAGLFVSIKNNHAEGFLPKRFLFEDGKHHMSSYFDQTHHMLRVGKVTYQLGQELKVTLIEANPTTCEVTFKLFEENKPEKKEKKGREKKGKERTAEERTGKKRNSRDKQHRGSTNKERTTIESPSIGKKDKSAKDKDFGRKGKRAQKP